MDLYAWVRNHVCAPGISMSSSCAVVVRRAAVRVVGASLSRCMQPAAPHPAATEAHDHDGLPHTLEHLVFMGSEAYPHKVLQWGLPICSLTRARATLGHRSGAALPNACPATVNSNLCASVSCLSVWVHAGCSGPFGQSLSGPGDQCLDRRGPHVLHSNHGRQ